MKKIIISLSLAFMTLFNTSCEKFLDEPVLGYENLDDYFSNEKECESYLYGIYAKITNGSWNPVYIWWVMSDMATDDLWMGSTYQPALYVNFQPIAHYEGGTDATTNIYLADFWEVRYKGIFAANLAISKYEASDVLSPEKKAQFIAEAKFLRGYFYFELVKNFGGVPLMLTQLEPKELLSVKRSSAEEIYAQIESDLTHAASMLPLKSGMDYASGRANRGMAEALLGKVYLYQGKNDLAYASITNVVSSGEYSLESNFTDVWSSNDNSPEAIFEIQTSTDQSYVLGNSLPVVTGSRNDSGWAWGGPTSDLENNYDSGDKRLAATIAKSGDNVKGGDLLTMTADWHKSNRLISKFYIQKADRNSPYAHSTNKLNHHILRYADVLLMYAELGYQTYPNQARNAVNMVRKRAGLADYEYSPTMTNPLDASVSAEDKELALNNLRDEIRKQRRLELAFEGNRLYDIRRWKMDDDRRMIEHLMGADGSFVKYNTQTSSDEYETINQIEPSNKGFSFKAERDLLFPIPNTDVQLSGGVIEQNPNF